MPSALIAFSAASKPVAAVAAALSVVAMPATPGKARARPAADLALCARLDANDVLLCVAVFLRLALLLRGFGGVC